MFKYYLMRVLRNKIYLFWCLAFPLVIMGCMFTAFGNIYNVENSIDPIKTVLIMDSEGDYALGFKSLLDRFSVSDSEEYFFDMVEASGREDAMEKVRKGDVELLFVAGDKDIEVYLTENHTTTSGVISKSMADTYKSNYKVISEAYETAPDKVEEIMKGLTESFEYTKVDYGNFADDPNPYTWYFFSTLVMGIFFTAMTGVNLVSDLKADVSNEAARLSLSPSSKTKMIWYAFMARLIPGIVISAIHLACMKFIFKIPMGNNIFRIILFVLVADIFAISFGVVCGLIFKGNIEARENKTTAVLMVSVFISGEMVMQLPGIIEKTCPIINDVNPATIMNMAFYRMSMYNDPIDFYLNMGKLVLVSLIFLAIGVIVLRREKYASV